MSKFAERFLVRLFGEWLLGLNKKINIILNDFREKEEDGKYYGESR